jgi:hypothetical protein
MPSATRRWVDVMLQTSVVHLHFLTPLRLRCLHMRAREVGADTSQVQCYLEALEALLDREFDDRGGRYLSASMPLGRDPPGMSVHSRRSDTHTDVLTDLNSRFERGCHALGVYSGQVSTGASSNSDLGQGVHER